MLGATIGQLRAEGILPPQGDGAEMPAHSHVSVKEAVLPFKRFRTHEGQVVDSLLGPEMRSTGEVMGIAADFGAAFAKSQLGFGPGLPRKGTVFVSVANRDKRAMIFPMKRLADLGFELTATRGTADVLRRNGIYASVVRKHSEGTGPAGEPTIVQRIVAGEIQMVINTPSGVDARADGYAIRAATTSMDRPIITTVQQLGAAVQGIESQLTDTVQVKSLQDHARELNLYARTADPARTEDQG
jgi:carbamoyl-phosphate synthase large subunit